MNKPSISERINARLREPEGEIFKAGKWRFWFALAFGLSLGSAILTAMIFAWSAGSLTVVAGVLVLWTLVGTLHYSDSEDSHLARGVSLLDSIALCFVVGHFCFAMWAYGHLLTLRGAEVKYEAAALAYNEKAEKIQADNVKIAASGEKIAEAGVKRAKLENDTAYQQRKAAEAGGRAVGRGRDASTSAPSLSTAPIELEKPKAPEESSARFLSHWDAWIRAANFGELILAAVTLIYIRNRSAHYNASYSGGNGPRIDFQGSAHSLTPATVAPLRRGDSKTATAVATVAEGHDSTLKALRDHLREIAFGIPKHWFKVDLIPGGVTIRLCRREAGRELTVKQTRQSNKILSAVNRPDFRERLTRELIACGFPIEGGGR
jgi:hypothetical protein